MAKIRRIICFITIFILTFFVGYGILSQVFKENDYLNEEIVRLQERINELKNEIQTLEQQREDKDKEYFIENGFLLYISMDAISFEVDDKIEVTVKLYNLSDELQTISILVFLPHVPTATIIAEHEYPQIPETVSIRGNHYIQYSFSLLGEVECEQGSHELTYSMIYYLNYGQPEQKEMELYSNTVIFDIIKK